MCLFTNRSSSNACIMVLPKLLVLLCVPFLYPLLCRWRFLVHALWLKCKTWVSAVLAGALLTLFFAWNVTQSVRSSWKQSIVVHRDRVAHRLFWLINGARTLTIKHSIFSVMAGLIAEMIFMLLSIYNVVGWVENQWMRNALANGFSAS